MDGVQNISFNIYAESEEEANALKGEIVRFISWFGDRGIKVTASKVAQAMSQWDKNPLVRNRIITYLNNERN